MIPPRLRVQEMEGRARAVNPLKQEFHFPHIDSTGKIIAVGEQFKCGPIRDEHCPILQVHRRGRIQRIENGPPLPFHQIVAAIAVRIHRTGPWHRLHLIEPLTRHRQWIAQLPPLSTTQMQADTPRRVRQGGGAPQSIIIARHRRPLHPESPSPIVRQ
jgi:hypothetical protein